MFVYIYKQLTKKLYVLYNEDALSTCYLLDYLAIYVLLILVWLRNAT